MILNKLNVSFFLFIADPVCESNMNRLGKTEVCLVLTNKFEVPESDDSSLNKLFIITKELLVSVLPFLKGDSLADALASSSTPVQEKRYDEKSNCFSSSAVKTVNKKRFLFLFFPEIETFFSKKFSLFVFKLFLKFLVLFFSSSLNDCKSQLRAYLSKLELGGWVSRTDGYQNIITAVAKDLCNKSKYRVLRRSELQTLKSTKQSLDAKTRYYEEQVQFYNEYIHRCLENLNTGKGFVSNLLFL